MRALLIVNPAAGGGTARADVDALLGTFRERFADVEVAETGAESPTAEDLARRGVAEKFDTVLVAGGDGTVGVAARALVNTEVTLGILPFGSFMNIARAVGIPREDRPAAAQIIAAGHTRAIDVGRVGEHLFFEAAGIGLDAHAFEAGHAYQKGERSAAVAAVGALLRRSGVRVRIEADGRVHSHRVLQVVVCNGPWYGWGFEVAPGARIDDGKLEAVVFGGGRLAVFRELVAAAIDRDRPARGVRYLGKRISLSSREPLEVHADGQLVGSLPQTFEALPRALRVFAPQA